VTMVAASLRPDSIARPTRCPISSFGRGTIALRSGTPAMELHMYGQRGSAYAAQVQSADRSACAGNAARAATSVR
jgi:hypothetical protein